MSTLLEATDPALLIPPGARLLHVGPPKTGTTALQKAAAAQREVLLEQGVLYPGKGYSHRRATFRFAGRTEGWGTPTPGDRKVWETLRDQVVAEQERRVWLSSEDVAELDPALVPRLLSELGGDVHVVMTLRSLPALLASAWSQYLKTGLRVEFEQWAKGVLSEPPRKDLTPSFRRRTDLTQLVTRWRDAVGPDHLTLVVLDPGDRDLVPRTFETLLGLEPGTLTGVELGGDASNRSFTRAEGELVRRLNSRIRRSGKVPWQDYERYVRNSTVPGMLRRVPGRDEPKLVPPRWAVDRLVELAQGHRDALSALDVRVVGDLERLATPTASLDEPPPPVGLPVEALLAGLSACLNRRLATERKTAARITPALLEEVPGRVLARTIATRATRALRRQLPVGRAGSA